MKFSIIICTLNRPDFLKSAIESIFNQTYNNYEIIIIDQSDVVNNSSYLKNDSIKYFHIDKKGLSNARNIGLKYSTGDFIILMDDDSELNESTLQYANSFFKKNKDIDILCGKIIDKTNGLKFNKNMPDCVCSINMKNYMSFPSASQIIRKSLFDNISFDDNFGLGRYFGSSEESDVLLQFLYKKIEGVYDPKMIVYHPFPKQGSVSNEKLNSYALGYGAFVKKHYTLFSNKRIYNDFKISIIKKIVMLLVYLLTFNLKGFKSFLGIIKYNIKGFKEYDFREYSNILVSVLMCTYKTNNDYLLESVNSILNQTYRNLEFIIVVDGDSENYDFLKRIKDDRIVVSYNEANMGLTSSLNKGLKLCNGSYIARMDSDDISLPNRIEQELRYIIKNKLDVVGMNAMTIGDVSGLSINILSKSEMIKKQLMYESVFIHPTVMFRREFLNNNDLWYDPTDDFRYAEDYEMWVKCSKIGLLGICDNIGLKYRVHSSQISSTRIKDQLNKRKKIYTIYGSIYNIKIDESLNNILYNGKTNNLKQLSNDIKMFVKKYPEFKEVLFFKYLFIHKVSKKSINDILNFDIITMLLYPKNIINSIKYIYCKMKCRKEK